MNEDKSGSSTAQSALSATAIAWESFLNTVDAVPRSRVDEPGVCGDWSCKTLIAHVAFWDGCEADRWMSGRPVEEVDFQPLNEQNALESSPRPYAEIRAELVTNHARAIQAIMASSTITPIRVRELFDDHYLEHGQEIKEWLARS